MRTQALDDDDVLEPLPVFVDGVAFAPVFASRAQRVVAESPRADAFIEATPAAIAEVPAVHGLVPWPGSEVRAVPSVHVAGCTGAFSRMIALRAGVLDSLPEWWRRRAHDERVEIANRLFLDRPRRDRADTWRMRGTLRSPCSPRAIPLELFLWPRLEKWTKLSLEPQRGVRVGRRYFSNGHHVLDELCAELVHELTPDAAPLGSRLPA